MKVTAITAIKSHDGKDLWKIQLEGTDKPAWANFEPPYKAGDDIPDELLPVNQKGNYVLKRAKTEGKPQQFRNGRSPEERDSIERQSARRDAVELYKHTTESGVPFDSEGFGKLYKLMLAIVSPVVTEGIKQGGKISA